MTSLIKTLSTAALSGVLLSTSVNAQEPAKPAQPNKVELQKLAQTFQQLLQQGVAFKDADALRIMAAAKQNNGEVKVTPEEMQAQVEKWQKTSIPARFQKLFAEKIKAKEENALALQKEMVAAQSGDQQLEMTPERMTKLVKTWETQNAKAKEATKAPETK